MVKKKITKPIKKKTLKKKVVKKKIDDPEQIKMVVPSKKKVLKKVVKTKICPDCNLKVGIRTKDCKDCGHIFEISKKVIKNAKTCPQCTEKLRPRCKECTKCQYKYPIKKSGYEIIKDWRVLPEGYQFYLRKKSRGPYYQGETDKLLMAYRGKFTVRAIYEDGLLAIGAEGYSFIYMGDDEICPKTGLFKRKYRLFKKS